MSNSPPVETCGESGKVSKKLNLSSAGDSRSLEPDAPSTMGNADGSSAGSKQGEETSPIRLVADVGKCPHLRLKKTICGVTNKCLRRVCPTRARRLRGQYENVTPVTNRLPHTGKAVATRSSDVPDKTNGLPHTGKAVAPIIGIIGCQKWFAPHRQGGCSNARGIASRKRA